MKRDEFFLEIHMYKDLMQSLKTSKSPYPPLSNEAAGKKNFKADFRPFRVQPAVHNICDLLVDALL